MIFHIGLNKTGSTSLAEALEILGYNVCNNCSGLKDQIVKNLSHNEECPECTDAIIIDDHDLQQWNFVASMAHLQSALGCNDEDMEWIEIDSAKTKTENT